MHKTTEMSIFDSSTLDFNVSEYFSMGYTYIAMYLEEIIEVYHSYSFKFKNLFFILYDIRNMLDNVIIHLCYITLAKNSYLRERI